MKLEDIDIRNTKIETERLILRPFEEKDADDLYEYAKVPGVGESAGWKHHESREESLAVVRSFIARHRTFAICEKESGKVIGSVSYETSSDVYNGCGLGENRNDVGYVIGKDYWGKGYAAETLRAALGFAFRVLGLDAVTCGHLAGNSASRRIIEESGFNFLRGGTYVTQQGEEHEAYYYVVTKDDYDAESKS